MFTLTQVTEGSKVSLRAMCKEAGIQNYSTMSVAGMKVALSAYLQAGEPVLQGTPIEPTNYSAVVQQAAAEFVNSAPIEEVTEAVASVPAAPVSLPAPAFTAEYFANMRVSRDMFVPPLAPMVANPSKPAKAPRVQMSEQNGQRMPKPGTTCRAIWEFCEAQNAAGIRPEVKAVRAALGIGGVGGGTFDHTTCTVQFYAWRRFHGIRGR